MAETRVMRADEIVAGFNGVTDRQYWRASIAGSRVNPEVHFNSRATMVRVSYRVATDDFTVTFSKTDAAFGDFLASAHRAMQQVLVALKASGMPVDIADNAALQIEYRPGTKTTVVRLAEEGARWLDVAPMPFKVPERCTTAEIALDPNPDKYLDIGLDDL